MNKGYFITGTNTDVGKTYVTALIVDYFNKLNHSTAYYKAALSGAEIENGTLIPGDAQFVQEFTHIEPNAIKVSYTLKTAVSPHLASKMENIIINFDKIKEDFTTLQNQYDVVIVEGSGGIICPIYEGQTLLMLEDIIKMTDYPLIIITRSDLGAINEAILTANYALTHHLPVKGFIMNNFDSSNFLHQDNKRMIEKISQLPVLGYVETNGQEIVGIID